MEGSREGRRGGERTAKYRGEAGCISMLGQRKVIPSWADDPVRIHGGLWWRGCRGRMGLPPPEIHQESGREGGAGQVKST